MIRVRDLSHETFRRMARFVRQAREEGKSDRGIMLALQVSKEDLDFIDKFNDRTDKPDEAAVGALQ